MPIGGGSASELVLSLLGGAKPKSADLRRLRRLLDETPAEPDPPEEEAR